jgi:WD repeat and SOF domain-containing protein 1
VDSVNCVRFNPAERSLFASTGSSDRSIVLYDLRADVPMRKIVCPMRTNALDWNPREPFNFVTANEDYNCYSFDIRKLDQALLIHKDHTLAVMDVRHSPTGGMYRYACG